MRLTAPASHGRRRGQRRPPCRLPCRTAATPAAQTRSRRSVFTPSALFSGGRRGPWGEAGHGRAEGAAGAHLLRRQQPGCGLHEGSQAAGGRGAAQRRPPEDDTSAARALRCCSSAAQALCCRSSSAACSQWLQLSIAAPLLAQLTHPAHGISVGGPPAAAHQPLSSLPRTTEDGSLAFGPPLPCRRCRPGAALEDAPHLSWLRRPMPCSRGSVLHHAVHEHLAKAFWISARAPVTASPTAVRCGPEQSQEGRQGQVHAGKRSMPSGRPALSAGCWCIAAWKTLPVLRGLKPLQRHPADHTHSMNAVIRTTACP